MTESTSRKFLFYTIFSVFILWIAVEPNIVLSNKNAVLIVFFVVLGHSLLDKRHLYSKLSRKYKNQTKLLNDLFINSPDLVYRKDSKLKYKDCNLVMKHMLNMDEEESIVNKTDYDLYPDETAEIIRTYDQKVLDSGMVASYKIEKRHNITGEVEIYDTLIAPITNETEIIGVIGILRDVTQVEALKEKILTQNAQMESILNNMPYLVYIKDMDGKLIFSNSHTPNDIGIPFKFVSNEDFAEKYYPDNPDIITDEDKQVAETQKTLVLEKKISHSKEEPPHWYQISKSPILDSQGNVTNILVMIKNIDKEKELEAQKETLVATITHDLKTPTNAQLSAMDYLLSERLGQLAPVQKEYIQMVKNSNIYMRTMISTILDTFKAEQEDITPKPEVFNFYKLVQDTAKEISNLAISKNQTIVIGSKLETEKIQADPIQIKRVITNLLGNAITYGFEKTNINVTITEKDDDVIIDVINKGYYITEDKIAEIFEKYKTSENAKFNKASTGLGLYLSRRIVQAHNGQIYAKSFKNKTCIFGFVIPRGDITEQNDEQPALQQ